MLMNARPIKDNKQRKIRKKLQFHTKIRILILSY